jgi:hypothetical protein
LNTRSTDYESGALAGLSYGPTSLFSNIAVPVQI